MSAMFTCARRRAARSLAWFPSFPVVRARPLGSARFTAAARAWGFAGALTAMTVSCSSSPPPAQLAEFSAFKDLDSAPPAVQVAAAAVFRIRTANSLATGSFISSDGLVLTNNHVLGIDVCPREGCYASLTLHHERHSPTATPFDVFLVPLHVSVGLDMAVLQAYSVDAAGNRLDKLPSPSFLQIDPHDASSLIGSTVFVVGHPEGHLKKWTTGQVADEEGSWFRASAFSLPGNSGSPFLDASGHIVGLLHRGPTGEDLVTRGGVDIYSVGTASAALVAAMNDELPAEMHSVVADASEDDVVKNQLVYRNARVPTASIAAAPGSTDPSAARSVLTALGEACDRALVNTDYASPEDMEALEAPCFDAEAWIDCRSAASAAAVPLCPDVTARAAWASRYSAIFARHRALNGDMFLDELTFAQSSLENTDAAGTASGAAALQRFLDDAHPPLDFEIAPYLSAFGITSYGGTVLLDFVHDYAKSPHYELSLGGIVNTALWLNHYQAMTFEDVFMTFDKLDADPKMNLGMKLRIEEVRKASKNID